jgi:predicted ABC-type ATPase
VLNLLRLLWVFLIALRSCRAASSSPDPTVQERQRSHASFCQRKPRSFTWKAFGYRTEIAYLKIDSPQIALKRIAARVKQGGHDVASGDVLRRFGRSWKNFVALYRPLVDAWAVYDNSGVEPRLLEQSP